MTRKSKHSLWLVALCLSLYPSTVAAWPSKVIGVTDGDTITVLHGKEPEKIRLWGIDCPEKGQDFRNRAKQLTSTLVFGKVVEVEPVTMDRYGRAVALVSTRRTLVNEELIRQGLAWVFTRYCDRPICQGWKVLARITHEPPTATADMALPSGCPRVSNFATY